MNQTLLKVKIAGRDAALPAAIVRSVIEPGTMASVPGAPAHMVGLSALRSQAMMVVDPAIAMGLGKVTIGENTRAAVIEQDRHLYAILVDQADEVAESIGEITETPGQLGKGWSAVVDGLLETDVGPLLVLNASKLIEGPKVIRAKAKAA